MEGKRVLRTTGIVAVMMGFLWCGTLAAQESITKADSKVLAVVNGQPVNMDDVEQAAAPAIKSIEARKAQFEIEIQRDRRTALEEALDGIVRDRVLAAEAQKRKITVDELIAIQVDGAVPRPTDEEIVQFYNAHQADLEGSLADNAAAIRDYLRNDRRQPVYDAFVARLKNDYGVKSYLEPERAVIAIAGRPSKGPIDAPVTIAEFSDFECPFCRALFPTLKRIEQDYKDKVRIVYLQFPLVSLHTRARKAAEASLCAYEQNKFWELHDAMFNDQQNLGVDDLKQKAAKLSLDMKAFNSCLESGKYLTEIQGDVAEGVRVGVSGTPAMFINGRLIVGAQPYAEIQKVIEDELKRAPTN
jgi:protein-disulfide isomerase